MKIFETGCFSCSYRQGKTKNLENDDAKGRGNHIDRARDRMLSKCSGAYLSRFRVGGQIRFTSKALVSIETPHVIACSVGEAERT